jgi:hypothetical protein
MITVHRLSPTGVWRAGRISLPVTPARLRHWYRFERTQNGRDRHAARAFTIAMLLPEAVAA